MEAIVCEACGLCRPLPRSESCVSLVRIIAFLGVVQLKMGSIHGSIFENTELYTVFLRGGVSMASWQ